ncbi:MAG: class I SAM-dependent methyltransferase [Oscillospiraceae bacterium]|jgi:ubiquinone/menaquinone biosynthesis C-methylase UbiE|nr:class I SAM-dependent methyltransferase [Oscillospiraceae bacterium]
MKNTDILVNLIMEEIENKTVLEVACGAADFSVSASAYSDCVYCIDLDARRLNGKTAANIHFQIMDASKMVYADNTFDTVILYNAFSHIQTQWIEIEQECKRVLKADGVIYIVGTWKLDVHNIMDVFGDKARWRNQFLIVEIRK